MHAKFKYVEISSGFMGHSHIAAFLSVCKPMSRQSLGVEAIPKELSLCQVYHHFVRSLDQHALVWALRSAAGL